MGISIRIIDEQFGKTKTPIFDLIYTQETITAREFITRRVEEEIAQLKPSLSLKCERRQA